MYQNTLHQDKQLYHIFTAQTCMRNTVILINARTTEREQVRNMLTSTKISYIQKKNA
jgi:hypothetical protein